MPVEVDVQWLQQKNSDLFRGLGEKRKGKPSWWGSDSSYMELRPVLVAAKPQASGFCVNLCPKVGRQM